MNDPNPWETRLQSWTPRAPSPSLKGKLFPPPACPPANRKTQAFWPRLAPALGCLLLTIVVAANHSPGLTNQDSSELARHYVQSSNSNPALISYRMPVTLEHNVFARFPRATFEWTNQSPFPSTTGSFLLLKTNSL